MGFVQIFLCEGDHNPSFRASSVVVKGVTFDTTTDSRSSKDAQNDAARFAVHHSIASGITFCLLFEDLILV